MSLESTLWQATGRHLDLEEFLAAAGPMLCEHLPVRAVYVRRLDGAENRVRTAAAHGPDADRWTGRLRSDLLPADLQVLAAWCLTDAVLDRQSNRDVPADAIASPLAFGPLVAVPLHDENQPLGFVVFAGDDADLLSAASRDRIADLREPFTTALKNDGRLRELKRLREAAEADNRALLNRLERHDIAEAVIGEESGLREVMRQVEQVASSDVPVLILGETGSGKEVIARRIHEMSRRGAGPIVRVNCGAIPGELIDAELFGHERGSFTGAVALRKGWFERADGGTLMLDEVGELPAAAQVRLLRVLQDGTFFRVGAQQPISVDVRVVAATHRDLPSMVSQGLFREDLWYRLSVFPIRLPPLRERIADIGPLARHFAARTGRRMGGMPLPLTAEDLSILCSYHWPGNARELAAVIERAAILGDGRHLEVAAALGMARVRPADLPPTPVTGGYADVSAALPSSAGFGQPVFNPGSVTSAVPGSGGPIAFQGGYPVTRAPQVGGGAGAASWSQETGAGQGGRIDATSLETAMARHIEGALAATGGLIEGPSGAAARLGINPSTLRSRMRKLGIRWEDFRPRRPVY
jgi:hydrogenase-4 transcriptional activator